MKIKNIIAIFIIGKALISCSGQLDSSASSALNTKMTFGDYLNDMSKFKGAGTVLIQSNDYLISQVTPNHISIAERSGKPGSISFYDNKGATLKIVGESNQNLNKTLFGQNLDYSIDGVKSSIYIPQLLNIKVNSVKGKLKIGTTITWNLDKLNLKGLVIWISYKPTTQFFAIQQNNRFYITEGFVVDDNGSYTISAKDLERIPNNSNVELNIARTNYIINDVSKPSLIAFTTVTSNYVLEK